MQIPTAAGRGGWRGHPETSGGAALSFAVNSRPRPPSSMLGVNSNPLVSAASAPSAALCSVGRTSSVLRGFPREGGSGGDDSGPRRRRVRARGGSAVCMMAAQKPSQQSRKARPPPVSAGGVGVGPAAAAPAPALDDPRETVAAIYACEGRGRWYMLHVLSRLKCPVVYRSGPFRRRPWCTCTYIHVLCNLRNRPERLHGRPNQYRYSVVFLRLRSRRELSRANFRPVLYMYVVGNHVQHSFAAFLSIKNVACAPGAAAAHVHPCDNVRSSST